MIEVKDLRVVYRPWNIEALKGIYLSIPRNKVICVLGPNASGKTTLLKSIANLIDYEGVILIDKVNTRKLGKLFRKMISYTSSIEKTRFLGVSVLDALLISRYPVSKGFIDTREDYEEVKRIAKELGITHLLRRRIDELSSGELQKVVLAMALVKKPSTLLLDEPDNHLDIGMKPFLSRFLRRISSELTVILSTHDPLFATHVCDYYILLHNGVVKFMGTHEDLVKNTKILEEVFGVGFELIETEARK
ncbi:MAG: ABC transporter ATP-binding protein, partial [Desulfurococcaceae archaeon]